MYLQGRYKTSAQVVRQERLTIPWIGAICIPQVHRSFAPSVDALRDMILPTAKIAK
jgi:hypothetical protein